MEIHLLPLSLTTLTLLLLTPFILFLIKQWRPKPHGHHPPSPPELPVIGHLHHLVGQLPHHALSLLSRKYGPVLHLRLGQVSAVAISSAEAAKEVLKSQDPACAERPDSIGTKIMWHDHDGLAFSPYGDHWRQMRKICMLELLSPRNVRSFASIRRDEVSRLVRSLRSSSGRPVNLTAMIFELTSSTTFRTACGKVMSERHALVEMIRGAVTMAGRFELADLFPCSKLLHLLCWNRYRLLGMRRKVDRILDVIIEEHRLNLKQSGEFGGEDIVDVMLRKQKNGDVQFPVTNDNIKALLFDMFSAGIETTSTTIGWAMAELMRNPKVMQKAQAEVRCALKGKGKGKASVEDGDVDELKYLKLVIKETLRLHPPLPLIPRSCRAECNVQGFSIPVGSKVMVNVWSMGRDPQYWDRPEMFRPERFEFEGSTNSFNFSGSMMEYIPFGAGRRSCPGISLGLATLEMTLAQLLYHFDWGMPEGDGMIVDMTEAEGITVARKNALFLVPTLYA